MQTQPVAQPAEPEDQTGVLVALCGLGALLGFGATRYRAALALAGKRALPVTRARVAAPIMQVAPGEVQLNKSSPFIMR